MSFFLFYFIRAIFNVIFLNTIIVNIWKIGYFVVVVVVCVFCAMHSQENKKHLLKENSLLLYEGVYKT